ncbi:hypothetical protein HYV84_07095 [Candidatus Woesearchaeota archaeon]|nr:hypothetical protein [Candidatus Woesearchaeota archaeon]
MASRAFQLEEFVRILDSWGLRDVMLPFLLVFVVFFAVLHKTNILGKDRDKLNLVLALVVALLVIIPHVTGLYPANMDPVEIFNEVIPSISIIIIAAIGALIIMGVLGGQVANKPMYATGGVVLTAAVIYVIFVYPDMSPLLLGLAVVLLIMNFFSKGTKIEGMVQGGITVAAFIVVLYFFGVARGWFQQLPDWLTDSTYQGVIIFTMILLTLVIYMFSSDDDGGGHH